MHQCVGGGGEGRDEGENEWRWGAGVSKQGDCINAERMGRVY